MYTQEQPNEAKKLIKQYESERLDLSRIMCSKSATTTTIPQEKRGVHRTHCCSEHGCKYGDNVQKTELNNTDKKLHISDVLCSFYDYHWKRTDVVEKFYDYHWKTPIKIA